MSARTAAFGSSALIRWAVLAITLVGFAHVVFGLDSKDLWWDESLSLQRAESALAPLLRGTLVIQDGFTETPTTDQHPFFSFLLQALLIRSSGNSEFALRWPAAAAATALAPALFALGRLLERRGVAPGRACLWAALLASLSPFFLWYGQEARGYALWALLSVLSTRALLAALEAHGGHARRLWAGYGVAVVLMLGTHFYAGFLLPVHAVLVYAELAQRNRRRAIQIAFLLLLSAAAMVTTAAVIVLSQGGGINFPDVSMAILLPDLLNAYTLGLSVNIEQVLWLDVAVALLGLIGAYSMLDRRAKVRAGGWVTPAWLVTPILLVIAGGIFFPLYMNARHLAVVAPAWLLLVACGLAWLGERNRWSPLAPALLVFGGFAFSTFNYYTQEQYRKDDYTSLGAYMTPRLLTGDLILYYPPSSWRIFDYYLEMPRVYRAIDEGADIAVHGVPLLSAERDTFVWLDVAARSARRTWVIKSGTHPFYDLEGSVEAWMRANLVQVRDVEFFSHSSLRAQLYLPGAPVDESASRDVPNATDALYGDNIRLIGIEPDWPAPSDDEAGWGLSLPVTLYWQVNTRPERNAKYRLAIEHVTADGLVTLIGQIEREPFEGSIPTTYWDPGKTIIEVAELPWNLPPGGLSSGTLRASLMMYDAETLAPLPVAATGTDAANDGFTATLPLEGAGRE